MVALVGSPYTEEHSILGSILGPPIYGNLHIVWLHLASGLRSACLESVPKEGLSAKPRN